MQVSTKHNLKGVPLDALVTWMMADAWFNSDGKYTIFCCKELTLSDANNHDGEGGKG